MGQTVYLDLFFIINFSMDFLCFYLSGTLLGNKLSVLRMLLAAALGGIYADITLFLPLSGIWELALHGAVCVLMCLCAFGKARVAANTCVYIATSAVLGGFMTALFELLNSADIPLSEVKSDGISAWLLLALAVISAIITLLGGRFFRRKTAKKYVKVTLKLQGRSKQLSGFCDSGNLLRDPIGGKSCIVVDTEAVSDLIPKELLSASSDGFTHIPTDMGRRVRLIPATTATGSGMLLAIRMDSVLLDGREVDALVALSELGKNDGCDALVPSQLLI